MLLGLGVFNNVSVIISVPLNEVDNALIRYVISGPNVFKITLVASSSNTLVAFSYVGCNNLLI